MSSACRGRFHACKSAHPREEFQFCFFVPILIRIGDCLYGESVGEVHGTDVYVPNTGRLNTAISNELKTNINSNTQRHQICHDILRFLQLYSDYAPTTPLTPTHTGTYTHICKCSHKHAQRQHNTTNTGTTQRNATHFMPENRSVFQR